MVRLHASLLAVAAHLGEAAVFQFAKDQNEASLSSIASSETVEMLSAFSETILNPRTADSSNYQSVIRAVSDKMDLKTASKCKGLQDMNRETYAQVTRDIMRLIEQIH